jgi:hypothetical protein
MAICSDGKHKHEYRGWGVDRGRGSGRGSCQTAGVVHTLPLARRRKQGGDVGDTHTAHTHTRTHAHSHTRTLAHSHTRTRAHTRTYRWHPDAQALKVEGRVGGVLAVGTGRHWRGHVVLRREAAGGSNKGEAASRGKQQAGGTIARVLSRTRFSARSSGPGQGKPGHTIHRHCLDTMRWELSLDGH